VASASPADIAAFWERLAAPAGRSPASSSFLCYGRRKDWFCWTAGTCHTAPQLLHSSTCRLRLPSMPRNALEFSLLFHVNALQPISTLPACLLSAEAQRAGDASGGRKPPFQRWLRVPAIHLAHFCSRRGLPRMSAAAPLQPPSASLPRMPCLLYLPGLPVPL